MINLDKFQRVKFAAIPAILLLASCSSDSGYKHQADGSDAYLKSTPLIPLKTPSGVTLPEHNNEFDIPGVKSSGQIGKQVDIRPPAQLLALVTGSQSQFSGNSATLLLDQVPGEPLWSQINAIIKQLKYPIAAQDSTSQTLNTGWIEWVRKDENQPWRARYQITIKSSAYQQVLAVSVTELQHEGQAISDDKALQRYSAIMLNKLAYQLDQRENQRLAIQSSNSGDQLMVQSGADDVGLPVLIVRGTFNAVWVRLPDAMQKIGMTVKDSNRPQGSMTVSYKPLSESEWQQLGARDPGLASGDYKLQVGDLENRSSLQFIDPKGHTLSQSQNDALVAAFQAAFNV